MKRPQSGGVQLWTEDIFRTEGSVGMEGSSRLRSVTSGSLDVANALDRTLGVVDFLEEHFLTWTFVIIWKRFKF